MNDNSKKPELKEERDRIRAQMEFYFSDSNLSKDRFLKQEIQLSNEGFVDLSVFLKFNKIRQIATNVVQIAKSLKNSKLLELDESRTKVKRTIQFIEPSSKKVEKRTIYVENIPIKTTNDSLKKHFEKYGAVSYISLPKFKTSHQLKGFAFVEFEKKSSANEAVKSYENESNTENIVGKFPKSHKIITDLEKKIQKVIESIEHCRNSEATETNDANSSLKRKSNGVTGQEIDVKKIKIDPGKPLAKLPINSFESISVVSKKNWLKLKENFLNKQKNEIRDLKTELNRLNAELEQIMSEKFKAKHSNIKTDDIVKGCVLKLTLNVSDPEFDTTFRLSKQEFKNKYLKEHLDHVAYVDVEKNNNKILIRCKSNESAKVLLGDSSILVQFNKSLISGQEEIEYFEKILVNRSKKLNKKKKKDELDLIKEAVRSNKVNKIDVSCTESTTKFINSKPFSSLSNNKKRLDIEYINSSTLKKPQALKAHVIFDD